MNKIFTVLSAVLISASLWAQAPQSFSYQAVVRGTDNALVSNKKVGMKISLLQGSETGKAVYVETHTPTSNTNGLVSIAIGAGTKDASSTAFASIDWSKGPYFVKTETDLAGGTSYSLTTTSQLLSVPYAIHAKTAESIVGGSVLPSGGTNGQIITNCDGVPTWTTGGICPGKITALNCAGVSVNGLLNNGAIASNVSFVITYSGGNGGSYSAQSTSSTGVVGLIATLQAGSFATGNGSLTFTVSGTPTSVGNALFLVTIAGQVCSVSMVVQEKPSTIGIPGPNITDAENNTYKTVTIGTQTWMAENLKVTKYNDGTAIPNITDNTQWSQLSTGAWSYYNNDVANNAKYGKLYNWYAVSKISNGNKNVCPTGWHVPTDAEWTVLTEYLGSASVAGGKMKEVGTTSWNSPNTDATNTSLFTGLPGGFRYNDGSFNSIGNFGYWWSSTEDSTINAWFRYLGSANGVAGRNDGTKSIGLSVRCLRD
jgi:uncharacterized protein (TIGR02145 family)